MTAFQVLVLDTGTPDRVRAPGASDTYLFPRTVEWTTGVNTSNVANGASAVAFTLNTASAYTSNNGHKLLSVQTGGNEKLAVSYGSANQSTSTVLKSAGAFVVQPSGSTSDDFEYVPFLTVGIFNCRSTSGMVFNNYAANGATAKACLFYSQTNLTTTGALVARFAHNGGASGIIDFTKDGGITAAGGVGLFGTAAPTSQYNTTGTTTGFTASTGTTVVSGSTFTGNTGSTAYTIGDIVRAMKTYGLMAA